MTVFENKQCRLIFYPQSGKLRGFLINKVEEDKDKVFVKVGAAVDYLLKTQLQILSLEETISLTKLKNKYANIKQW